MSGRAGHAGAGAQAEEPPVSTAEAVETVSMERTVVTETSRSLMARLDAGTVGAVPTIGALPSPGIVGSSGSAPEADEAVWPASLDGSRALVRARATPYQWDGPTII